MTSMGYVMINVEAGIDFGRRTLIFWNLALAPLVRMRSYEAFRGAYSRNFPGGPLLSLASRFLSSFFFSAPRREPSSFWTFLEFFLCLEFLIACTTSFSLYWMYGCALRKKASRVAGVLTPTTLTKSNRGRRPHSKRYFFIPGVMVT